MLEYNIRNDGDNGGVMFVVDMHSDSLGRVTGNVGLVKKYNIPFDHAFLGFFAAFVPKRGRSAFERRRELMRYMDVYVSECSRLKLVTVHNCRDLNFATETESRSALFSIEGGGGLFADSEELGTLCKMGLGVMGLAWDGNELSASSMDERDTGLSHEGVKMVEKLSESGVIVDVSHMSDKAVADTLETSAYPVIATHSNFREVCPVSRNLPYDLAKRIVSRGGVIGLSLYPGHLSVERVADKNDIFAHIDYALDKLGEDSIAFGFDIDGTDGAYPLGFSESDSIHDTAVDMLSLRYKDRITEKIAGGNAIRFLKDNL